MQIEPEEIQLRVNGKLRSVRVDPSTPLLYVLRNNLKLNSPKFGCGLSQCGACTVILSGRAVRSCITQVGEVKNLEITTLEGLGTSENPGPLQRAFIEEQAAQCGYCTNGMIMRAKVLLDSNPKATDEEIKRALNGNLCRCGSHLRIVRAVRRAVRHKT
ncbi:MAG TPA: (2Fe-2S)-binding protein [Candidatus Acidoferrales bacterium]|nr:(2Fe-2S)-binding protein [Candidatus Acidoferrales bacterium]